MARNNIYAGKPWLRWYDPEVPPRLEYPRLSYWDYARRAFEKLPDKTALIYMGQLISYRELDALSNRLARFLQEHGGEPGSTVGVHLPNIPACYIASLAIQKAGCVFSGVSPLLAPEELAYQLKDSGAKILITLDLFFEKVRQIIAQTDLNTIIVASIADYLPALKRLLGKLLKKIPAGPVTSLPGSEVISFTRALSSMPEEPVKVEVDPEAPALMMYTGGTTGPPKGAILTPNNMIHQLVQMTAWMRPEIGEHTILSAFPMFHQAGNFVALWSFSLGSTQVLVPDPRDLDYIVAAIKKYRPSTMINVPTLFLELLKHPGFRALDFSDVQYAASGASPFPADSIEELEKLIGRGKLIEVYGMTETSPILTALPRDGIKKAGSVGLPISDTEIRLVDPATGEEVPPGEPGELVARGPQVFTKGYHNKPEETAKTLRDGWIYTGDIAVMDEDGYFYIVDRVKDMVNISGFKVFTRLVDETLMKHPDVHIAAAVGLPDPKRPGSEILACGVVLKPGRRGDEAMRQEIVSFLKNKLAPYKVPRIIRFMDQLPMSSVGKVLKKDLRKIMEQEQAR